MYYKYINNGYVQCFDDIAKERVNCCADVRTDNKSRIYDDVVGRDKRYVVVWAVARSYATWTTTGHDS